MYAQIDPESQILGDVPIYYTSITRLLALSSGSNFGAIARD
ncbi:MAG: hypothetical protein WCK79_08315 [Actinomycetes bacterium]